MLDALLRRLNWTLLRRLGALWCVRCYRPAWRAGWWSEGMSVCKRCAEEDVAFMGEVGKWLERT
jgi:hypothetical protein